MEEDKKEMMTVGILYICTGKYSQYWKLFYERCEAFLLLEDEKHYFVWTDNEDIIREADNNERIHVYYQTVEEWPYPTLKRFDYFLKAKKDIGEMDYLMFMNANLLVQCRISHNDILPGEHEEIFVTMHPGYYDCLLDQFTYDKNPKSEAYIPEHSGEYYFAGGFNGGKTEYFLKLIEDLNNRIQRDLQNGIIALWHDESHLNKYMTEYKGGYRILSPAYLYPEGCQFPFEEKIRILDKNKMGGHELMRSRERLRGQ